MSLDCDLNYFNCLEEAKCVICMDGEDEKYEHPSCNDSNISALGMYFHMCCEGTNVAKCGVLYMDEKYKDKYKYEERYKHEDK